MRGLTYAVPDLHGRFDLLDRALIRIGIESRRCGTGPRTTVFLGDYVDRGPDSRGVIDRLRAWRPAGWRVVLLLGNHDVSFREAVAHAGAGAGFPQWLKQGGRETLASYGTHEQMRDFHAYVPLEHVVWLDSLSPWFADDYRVYVHAGVDPMLSLMSQDRKVLTTKRYADDDPGHFTGGHVVHGHKSNEAGPLLLAGRTCLDTKAWKTGRLVVGEFADDQPGGPSRLIEITGPAGAEPTRAKASA